MEGRGPLLFFGPWLNWVFQPQKLQPILKLEGDNAAKAEIHQKQKPQ